MVHQLRKERSEIGMQTTVMSTTDIIRRVYYSIENPASFSSAENVLRECQRVDPRININDVKRFLSGEIAYTLHRRVVRKIQRNPIVATRHGEQAQADLVDIQRFAVANNGYRYILTVIDVFSKLAFAEPIKTKSAPDMVRALTKLFAIYRPINLQTDEGTEFTNASVRRLLRDMKVHWFPAKNEQIKCAIVERFQRTLMTKVTKYMTSQGTHTFVGVLPKFMTSYNNAFHRSIKMTPLEATTAPVNVVFKNLYGFPDERTMLRKLKARPKLNKGDHVRIPTQKDRFTKGYAQNFTDQVYFVDQPIPSTHRPVYRLKSHSGDIIKGNFYPEEVQRVVSNSTYRVNVLAERRRGRGKQYLVHYVDYPDTEDEWISGRRLQELS